MENKSGEQNETDLTTEQEESLVIRSMFSSNINKFFEVLIQILEWNRWNSK
jgi:hypothetical protein